MIPAQPNTLQTGLTRTLQDHSLAQIWSRYYPSQNTRTPLSDLSDVIKSQNLTPENNAHLLIFMNEILDIEEQALKRIPKHKRSETDLADIENIAQLKNYLQTLKERTPEAYAHTELPEQYQKIIDMLRTETAQHPVRPIQNLMRLVKNTGVHIAEDAREHPYAFTGLLGISLGALGLMNMRMGSTANIYIDPIATTITDLDFDSLEQMTNGADTALTLNPAFMNTGPAQSCHDHLTQVLGPTAADYVKNSLDAVNLFPQHCSKIKTLAQNAQGNLQSFYDTMNSRIAFMIHDPAQDIGNKIIPPSPFLDAFNHAANQTADFIYAANAIENVTLHTIIFASAVATTVKLGTLESEEAKEMRMKISDFFGRTTRNVPLNYLLCAAGSTYAYMANNGVNPEMIWMGLGGALIGQGIHNALNKNKSPALAQTLSVHIRDIDVHSLEASENITGNEKAGESLSAENKKSAWKKIITSKPAIASAVTGIASAADFAFNNGQISGTMLGGLSVTVPFLAYNVPEDATLHVILGFAGGVVGSIWAGGIRAKRALTNLLHRDTAPS